MDNVEDVIGGRNTPEEASKPKKKKRKLNWKFKLGLFALALGAVGIFLYNAGKLDAIIDWAKSLKKDDAPKDSITAIADKLPLDEDGIISITVPVGVKSLEEGSEDRTTESFYYLPPEFKEYYVFGDGQQVPLQGVTGDPRNNENVKYFETGDSTVATGYIGVQKDYAEFLAEADRIKAQIASGQDKTYSMPVQAANYEVADVYWLPAGYELYTENEEAAKAAQLLYVIDADGCKEDGRKLYLIPQQYIGDFIGITADAYNILSKGDELRAQMVQMYGIYSQSAGNMGYDEATNRGR